MPAGCLRRSSWGCSAWSPMARRLPSGALPRVACRWCTSAPKGVGGCWPATACSSCGCWASATTSSRCTETWTSRPRRMARSRRNCWSGWPRRGSRCLRPERASWPTPSSAGPTSMAGWRTRSRGGYHRVTRRPQRCRPVLSRPLPPRAISGTRCWPAQAGASMTHWCSNGWPPWGPSRSSPPRRTTTAPTSACAPPASKSAPRWRPSTAASGRRTRTGASGAPMSRAPSCP